ncbi:Selenocysteine lyase/Cysteine desulfurase [Pseudonocardia ammonioxydans]|uniref:Selenocysteine lyase/Cysteine desulfurase n=1 Tax=Pseudonocardia ammonioxydans TaxID=260086 RepID=A0A1I4X660_PSUAM|nr:aminotransferase class V-fold PLP-dependent enzyme [Pseudonocardia ammonioxydans]SFN20850.1 Selenocysteine lyase/Cysteine desulfurase [Pseudonocardia ammonioxydans]
MSTFPLDERVADLYPGAAGYLDCAAVGLISTRVRDAARSVLDEHLASGIAATAGWRARAGRVRRSVAALVGGAAERVAFTQNTSTGLALVVNGTGWLPGDNVVVPEGEFPSNLYPWLALRRRGVEIRTVPAPGGFADGDRVAELVDARTRVLAVSAVQYSSGHRYDLARLAGICRRHSALFVVDGTQCVGALRVDADDTGIDVLAVSAHKWLLGPFGIGFVHLSERAMEELQPSTVGWLSVEDPFAFAPQPRLSASASRFESGTENAAGIAGLGAAADLVLELGRDRVERSVLGAADALADTLRAAGLAVHRPGPPARHSGIVLASPADGSGAALHERLRAGGVVCSLRAGGVRLAPHHFTRPDDLDRVRAALVP